MKLMVSTDLGQTYSVHKKAKLHSLQKEALKLDKDITYRWVIVDGNDEPKHWCNLFEQQIHSVTSSDKKIQLVTGDKYLKKVATKRGADVMDERFIFRAAGLDPKKIPKMDMTQENLIKTLAGLGELTASGAIGVTPATGDDSKVGEELFGEDNYAKEKEDKKERE